MLPGGQYRPGPERGTEPGATRGPPARAGGAGDPDKERHTGRAPGRAATADSRLWATIRARGPSRFLGQSPGIQPLRIP